MKNQIRILLMIVIGAVFYFGCKTGSPDDSKDSGKISGPIPEDIVSLDSAESMILRFRNFYGRTRTAHKLSREAIDAILSDTSVNAIVFKKGKDADGNEVDLAFGDYSDSASDSEVKIYKTKYVNPCRCRPCCGTLAADTVSPKELCPVDSI
ncbi:MAG: hypothetical protein ABI855_01500 [Bacteroidota bacterium]